MTVVFVHGNPETEAIWGPLIDALGRGDVITLSPPGFGAPVPEGFAATSDDYLHWLEGEIERIPAPVDVVGHDWGGGHVMRLAMTRPDLIHSWTMDIAGCFDPEYVWHDNAQVWQTPGAGEEAAGQMAAMPAEVRIPAFSALGMGEAVARKVAPAVDAEMGRCILALYRSAAQPALAEWGKDLPKAAARPGHVIIACDDHYTGGEALARRSAEKAGAKVTVLHGLGHWWMCQDPKRGAQALREFFATLS